MSYLYPITIPIHFISLSIYIPIPFHISINLLILSISYLYPFTISIHLLFLSIDHHYLSIWYLHAFSSNIHFISLFTFMFLLRKSVYPSSLYLYPTTSYISWIWSHHSATLYNQNCGRKRFTTFESRNWKFLWN